MGGRICGVLDCRRRSHDHRGRRIPNGITFHSFPAWRSREGEQVSRLTRSRRAAWVAAVDREDITFNRIPPSIRVCSRHFHSGKPASEESDPDWVPTLNLGPGEGLTRRTKRPLQAVGRGTRDQNQRRTAETRPPRETETRPPRETEGPERPAVRPWTEVRSLLVSVLQRETSLDHQRGGGTQEGGFRDFFRDALEAALEAASRSRTPSARQTSSSCVNCIWLQRRNTELEEELSRLA